MHEPVELIDDDLDIVAGGNISVDLNIADIDQRIRQVQVFGFANSQTAANVSAVDQDS